MREIGPHKNRGKLWPKWELNPQPLDEITAVLSTDVQSQMGAGCQYLKILCCSGTYCHCILPTTWLFYWFPGLATTNSEPLKLFALDTDFLHDSHSVTIILLRRAQLIFQKNKRGRGWYFVKPRVPKWLSLTFICLLWNVICLFGSVKFQALLCILYKCHKTMQCSQLAKASQGELTNIFQIKWLQIHNYTFT